MDRCGLYERQQLLRKSNQAQSIYVLISALLMIVALLFSRFLAKSLTYPLQRLRDSMSRVQEGHFDGADVEIDSENEIGSLTKSFNVMTHRIQDLMEQNVKEQEAKRKSELKALQSQINPHFLFNTLNAIRWKATINQDMEVAEVLAELGGTFSVKPTKAMLKCLEGKGHIYATECRSGRICKDKKTSGRTGIWGGYFNNPSSELLHYR